MPLQNLDLVDSISTLMRLISGLQSVVLEEQHQHHLALVRNEKYWAHPRLSNQKL